MRSSLLQTYYSISFRSPPLAVVLLLLCYKALGTLLKGCWSYHTLGLVSVAKSLKTAIDFPTGAASHIICDRICHDLSVDNPVINAISNSVLPTRPTLAFEYLFRIGCLCVHSTHFKFRAKTVHVWGKKSKP